MRRFLPLGGASALLIVFLSSACSTKVAHLEHDPSFTEAALNEGGLAIACVTSSLETDFDVHAFCNRYAPVLRQRLLTKRDVPVTAWGDVRRALGEEPATDLLEGYRAYGSLDPTMLETLATAIEGQARYVALARLEDDSIELEETPNQVLEEGKYVTRGQVRKTIRKDSITFRVYDLEKSSEVWETIIVGKKENKKTVEPDGPDGNILETIVEGLFYDEDGQPYPAAPERSAVIADIFGKFAKEVAIAPK